MMTERKGDRFMTAHTTRGGRSQRLALALAVLGAVALAGSIAPAQTPDRRSFPTPEQALAALAAAAKAHDRPAIVQILGARAKDLMSGDDVGDTIELDRLAGLVSEKVAVERQSDARVEFVLGNVGWPFAIPAVLEGGAWRFDTESGIDEILSRRIGSDEINAMAACRAYALAQWDYFTGDDWDKDGVAEYAQRLRSSEGARDGLYWRTTEGEDPSPLAGLVTRAEAVGYRVRTDGDARVAGPYYGYRFKILTGQGPHAPGGAHDYVINGNMIAGYAVVAWPVEWQNSGVMTFIVNQQGRVYQKNLGPDTEALAGAMEVYDPDSSWSLAGE
jgi:hypothetical protein